MIHSSRLVAVGADPNYAALFDAGGANQGLPEIYGPPAPWQTPPILEGPNTNVGISPLQRKQALSDCVNKCQTDRTNSTHAGWLADILYANCVEDCYARLGAGLNFGPGGVIAKQSDCSLDNIPACFTTAWGYVAHAGIEIALVALALLGLYLALK